MNPRVQKASGASDRPQTPAHRRAVREAVSLWIGFGLLAAGVAVPAQAQSGAMCSLSYDLPADIDLNYPFPDHAQARFDQMSWNSFLPLNAPHVGARVSRWGDNRTQWSHWSSTTDAVQCLQDPDSCDCDEGSQSGIRYYPSECQAIPGYQHYRVLNEVSKVDDLFLEAGEGGGLSNDPLLAIGAGNFCVMRS